MARDEIRKGPNFIHPEEASAVGSRNSLNRDSRDEYAEGEVIIDEEIDKIINHIHSKLPPEAAQDLKVMGNIKSHLHSYFNQSLQNMSNRYMVTAEDELAKKIRDLVDKEEQNSLNRYTPREIASLLNQIGGAGLFNTEEVEKSVVNISGHLQGHVHRETADFELKTNARLLQRDDIGGFIRGSNAYSVVRCSIRDNHRLPDKVSDVNLAINILESELISPIISQRLIYEHLVKNVVSDQVFRWINSEIDEINAQLRADDRPELSPAEQLFEKVKAIENYTDDDTSENAVRYKVLPKRFLDAFEGLTGELSDDVDKDLLGTRDSLFKMLEDEGMRTMGWNTAVNSLTGILDRSKMSFQHIENLKGHRKLTIREYEQMDKTQLPDECFELGLSYYTSEDIAAAKVAYSAQLSEFRHEITRLWNLLDKIYIEQKESRGDKDWDDIFEEVVTSKKPVAAGGFFGRGAAEDEIEEEERAWNEIVFVQRELNSLEEMNQSYESTFIEFRRRLALLRKKIERAYLKSFPDERMLLEGRLNFLEAEVIRFVDEINPYHVQPGLVMSVKITSIKRLRVTINGMNNVLDEFLSLASRAYKSDEVDKPQRHSHVVSDLMSFAQSAE